VTDPNLIVGYDTSDDAGVYRVTEELAIVVTADFITPPSDDPELFGRIGAANAMSDVYAMGGRPVACVNLVAFPSGKLGNDVLGGIVSGASQMINEAGAVLAGGHTIDDPEPQFGLAVTGIVHPERCWRNSGARPGDALVLTKRIGSGVLLNANLKGWAPEPALTTCIDSLVTLNRIAAEVAADVGVHAATDITGYGLACHTLEMARGAKATFAISLADVPVFDGARAMYERGVTTRSNRANRQMSEGDISFARSVTVVEEELLYDPQTNGGLLFAVAESKADVLVARLKDAGVSCTARIGMVVETHETGHLVVG
jgi:selenide,water dikinase